MKFLILDRKIGVPSMELKKLPYSFTICKLTDASDINFKSEFCFFSRTDQEISLVSKKIFIFSTNTLDTPPNIINREDGWRGFRIEGILDFSLIGILSKISTILAENKIGIFVVSTYNTDYVFVKDNSYEKAMNILSDAGYTIV